MSVGLAQGDYSYTARATDNFGAVTNSAVITLHVLPPVTTSADGLHCISTGWRDLPRTCNHLDQCQCRR